MEKLYSKYNIGSMELKNRWIMLAIHSGYSEEGYFSKRDIEFYRRRAQGGMAAITLVGGVSLVGATYCMNMLDDDKYIDSIKEVTDVIHEGDCKVIMQLYHTGRNNTVSLHGCQPIAPSQVPSPIYKDMPKEMTEEDILNVIDEFVSAALRVKRAGVDCIEVSASVGYLLSEFFSTKTNLRTDEWGNDDKGRMKFATELLIKIREAVGKDYPVIVKISGGDMLGGYDCDFMARFINQLPKGTIDGVTVTGGWHEAPVPQISYHVTPGGFSYLAKEIKDKTGVTVIACNRINNPETAEKLLVEGCCDFVGAARAFVADPDFADKAKAGVPYNRCQGCNRCIERTLKRKEVQCAFNSMAGKEYIVNVPKEKKNILVVGSGPVGLEAAKLSYEYGHQVHLITNEDHLGGKVLVASRPLFKEQFSKYAETKAFELRNCDIRYNTPLSREIIDEINPDVAIIAIGSEPIKIDIEGASPLNSEDVLNEKVVPEGDNVVVVGGGSVGLETAEFIAHKYNKKVCVVEMADKAGKDLGGLKWILMKHLKELGVLIKTERKALRMDGGKLATLSPDGTEEYINADSVVLAIGYSPRKAQSMIEYMKDKGIDTFEIGDCKDTKTILDGTRNAFVTVNEL